jgi:peptidoglycan hydrolase CwlO-like protein
MTELLEMLQNLTKQQEEQETTLAELRAAFQDAPQNRAMAGKIETLETELAATRATLTETANRLKVWEDKQARENPNGTAANPSQSQGAGGTSQTASARDASGGAPASGAPSRKRAWF